MRNADQLKLEPHQKWKIVSILSISFTSAFTLLFYTPLDMYLHNPLDFIVGWRFLLPPLFLLFLLCAVIIACILFASAACFGQGV